MVGFPVRPLALALVVFALGGAATREARAQGAEGSAALAEKAFQDGRRLMEAKKFAEACPKFRESHELAPAVGTLLNLADCFERSGQLASAWARFHEAIALAQRLGRPDREKTARERADKLEPRLIKLTIVSRERDAEVKLDGNVLGPAVLAGSVPVDPGKHTIDVSAKGKKTFSTALDVSERVKSPSVEIPPLETATEPAGTAQGPASPGAHGSQGDGSFVEPPTTPKSNGSTQRILGLAAMGAGVIGVGVGTAFGIKTMSTWSDAKSHCTGIDCDRTGVQLADSARSSGNLSTLAFVLGGVFAAGGAVLFFTAPSASSSRASAGVSVGLGTVTVGGQF